MTKRKMILLQVFSWFLLLMFCIPVYAQEVNPWKTLYREKIYELLRTDYSSVDASKLSYLLLEVDDDNIPELIIIPHLHGCPGSIVTYYDNKLSTYSIGGIDSLIEGSGLFSCKEVYRSDFSDRIYSLQHGEFSVLFEGEYSGYDDSYSMYGEPVPEKEYLDRLGALYPAEKANDTFSEMVQREILTAIEKYETGSIATGGSYDDHVIDFHGDMAAEHAVRQYIKKDEGDILLSDLKDLYMLVLHSNGDEKIHDISFVSELSELKSFYLQKNEVSDLSPLSGLTNLENLMISENPVHDFRPLSGLSELRSISLSNMKIKDFSFLSSMNSLIYIYTQGDQMTDEDLSDLVESIAELPNVTNLGLADNLIRDYSPLSSLKNLSWLSLRSSNLDDRALSDLAAVLSALPELKELVVVDNSITDVSCLASLGKLQILDIRENPVTDFSSLTGSSIVTIISDSYNGTPAGGDTTLYEAPVSVGSDTADGIRSIADILYIKKEENDIFPDAYYEGIGVKLGVNIGAGTDTPCLLVENSGNTRLGFKGIRIGMTREEVLETAKTFYPNAEYKQNDYLYLGGEGPGLMVKFDFDGLLKYFLYEVYYTG